VASVIEPGIGPSDAGPRSVDVATQQALQPAGPDAFRFIAAGPATSWDWLFGGQVLALALRAAGMTVASDRLPHSLHAYFLRRGARSKDVVLNVQRDTDGRSFWARRIALLQDNLPILTMAASFHIEETGPDDQSAVMAPAVSGPEQLSESRGPNGAGHGLIEVRDLPSAEPGLHRQAWAARRVRSATTLSCMSVF
jgi:acyl-CoA thioesterase